MTVGNRRGLRRGGRALAVGIMASVLLGPAGSFAGDGKASASGMLDSLIKQYAHIEGAGEEPDELRNVSRSAFLEDIATRRQLLEKVRRVDASTLSEEQSIDRRLMIGLLDSSIHTAESQRIWANDPSIYVPASEIGRALEPSSPGSAQQRAASLTSLLAKLPPRLNQGRHNLLRPPHRFTESAIFKTDGTIKSLQTSAPLLAGQAGPAGAPLLAATKTALAALTDYRRWLQEELLPRSDGSWALGKESYDYILQHRWFMKADSEEILRRGWESFKQTEALAQEVANRIEPGKNWVEVYEHLRDDHPQADDIKRAYQEKIDAAKAFVIDHQIVTLPAGERVITVDTPPAMRRSSPFGTFQSVSQFDAGLEGRLVLTPIEDWMTAQQRTERLRSHHRAWIPIIAVHEAYPGHHVNALKIKENPRLLRKVVRESIFSEGWGLFTEELMYEQGFLKGDDVRLTQLRNRLWRAVRVILDVSLHTGKMTFEQAADFLADKVRFDHYAAELDVDMYVHRPTYVLGYLIGMQEIMAIRKDYIAKYGEPKPPSEFYDRLLRIGAIPPVLVREELFAQKAAEVSGLQGRKPGGTP